MNYFTSPNITDCKMIVTSWINYLNGFLLRMDYKNTLFLIIILNLDWSEGLKGLVILKLCSLSFIFNAVIVKTEGIKSTGKKRPKDKIYVWYFIYCYSVNNLWISVGWDIFKEVLIILLSTYIRIHYIQPKNGKTFLKILSCS